MPAGLQLPGVQRWTSLGGVGASSIGTTVVDGAANAKGAYVQISASTPHAANWLLISTKADAAVECLMDIAVGAAASEQVIVSNILLSGTQAGGDMMLLPVSIPAGSRVAVRCQTSNAGARNVYVVLLIGQGESEFKGRATTYGAATADSGGTSVDPGATINTKGAYSQITASTTAPIEWLMICLGNQLNGAMADLAWLFDIAIGAAASEVVIIGNLQTWSNSIGDIVVPMGWCLPISIPVGTRIAVRSQCSGNDATDRLLDVVLIGVG